MNHCPRLARRAASLLTSLLVAGWLAACGGGDPEPLTPEMLRRRTLEAPAPTAYIRADATVRTLSGQNVAKSSVLVYAEVQADGRVLVYGEQPDGSLAGPILVDLGDATAGFARGQSTTLDIGGLAAVGAILGL